jgi:dolichol-phosphate mannosyltransferase
MARRAVLTGGTGFVGANLARRLLRDGDEVHLLVRPHHASWRIDDIRDHVRVVTCDLADPDGLLAALKEIRPYWIFHLAAHGAYPSQTDLDQMVATNIVGTVNLVSAALRVGFETLVNAGSSSEYGYKNHAPAEDEAIEPNSPYAVTKASATLFCRYIAQARRVKIPTLRLYSVYGPYEEPSRLMPRLLICGRRGELPPLVNPDVARDFVYAEDAAEAFIRAASAALTTMGPIYNIGTGRQTSLREVVEITRRRLEIPVEPNWKSMPDRSWDTSTWVADGARANRELGWTPSYDVARGFDAMLRWFEDNPRVWRRYERPAAN